MLRLPNINTRPKYHRFKRLRTSQARLIERETHLRYIKLLKSQKIIKGASPLQKQMYRGINLRVPATSYENTYNPVGRGVWGRMDTHIWMAESLHCSPETMTTSLISYTLIQNKKLKKKLRYDLLDVLYHPVEN